MPAKIKLFFFSPAVLDAHMGLEAPFKIVRVVCVICVIVFNKSGVLAPPCCLEVKG